MWRLTLTAATVAALFAVGQSPADAGDRPRASAQLSLGNGYTAGFGQSYRGGYSSGYSSNYGNPSSYGGRSRTYGYGGDAYGSRFDSGFSRGSGGNFGRSYGSRSGSGYGYGYGATGYGRGRSVSPSGYGAGHLDYHPTQAVPHGNHYDVIPGHTDVHRGGH